SRNEKIILSKIPDYENLLAPDFYLIDENGHHHNREEVIANHQPLLNNFDSFKMTSVSQKTKLISYELEGNFHTSIWRRNETWFMIYHQVTRIKDEN
ncbi:MAG: cation-efflux pump, partial [Streptococcus salivarius]